MKSVCCKRSFSALRRLKHWESACMSGQRLCGLVMLHVHRDKDVSKSNILKRFDEIGHRKNCKTPIYITIATECLLCDLAADSTWYLDFYLAYKFRCCWNFGVRTVSKRYNQSTEELNIVWPQFMVDGLKKNISLYLKVRLRYIDIFFSETSFCVDDE